MLALAPALHPPGRRLHRHGLGVWLARFRDGEVDEQVVPELTEQDLEVSQGCVLGHRFWAPGAGGVQTHGAGPGAGACRTP